MTAFSYGICSLFVARQPENKPYFKNFKLPRRHLFYFYQLFFSQLVRINPRWRPTTVHNVARCTERQYYRHQVYEMYIFLETHMQ